MGMDYIGENGTELHLNWSGHGLVTELVQDHYKLPKSWAHSNDGKYMGPRSCGNIATGLYLAIARNDYRLLKHPDSLPWAKQVAQFFDRLETQKMGCNQW